MAETKNKAIWTVMLAGNFNDLEKALDKVEEKGSMPADLYDRWHSAICQDDDGFGCELEARLRCVNMDELDLALSIDAPRHLLVGISGDGVDAVASLRYPSDSARTERPLIVREPTPENARVAQVLRDVAKSIRAALNEIT